MKKSLVVSFFTFALMMLFCGITSKVSAVNFWDIIGSYQVKESAEETRRRFSNEDEDYNYNFEYDYRLEATESIQDGYNSVYHFYGVNSPTTVNYVDLPKPNIFIDKDDRLVVYKFDYATRDFNTVYTSDGCHPDANTSGFCQISQEGIYKIVTDGISGLTPTVYLVYEINLYQMQVDDVNFYNVKEGRDYPSLEIDVTIKDPRHVSDITGARVDILKFNEADNQFQSAVLNAEVASFDVSQEDGSYKVKIIVDADSFGLKVLKVGRVRVTVSGTQKESEKVIEYDMRNPTIEDVKYYNSQLVLKGFEKQYVNGTDLVLPGGAQGTLVELKVGDDSELLEGGVVLNGQACVVQPYPGENNYYQVFCLINSDELYQDISEGYIEYVIMDKFENKVELVHENISFDHELIPQGDDFASHIELTDGNVIANFDSHGYEDIDEVCIFYGGDNWLDKPEYECGAKQVVPDYTYKGDIQVLVFNTASLYEKLTITDVDFANGYAASDFVKNDIIVNLDNHVIEIQDDIITLTNAACGDHLKCYGQIDLDTLFVKYGDLPEENLAIENVDKDNRKAFINYIDVLNNKIKLSQSATSKQNIKIEVIFQYNVGPTVQRISMVYNFVDELPNIKDAISTDDVKLEYKGFDITSIDTIQDLYADELNVELEDEAGTSYMGVITSRFVSYKNRAGVVTALNNESYEYIAEQSNFGHYTLECRVKLVKNITTNTVYTTNIYVKSFFVDVELKDSIIPTLTLLGDKEVEVKQHDVYKDAGSKCNDVSGCTVKVTYYFNSEDNEVEKVDTSKAGKYIIKYVAEDGDGNLSFVETRTLTVTGVNSLDQTSIIVIVAVAAILILVVGIAVIMEVNKNKKLKNQIS